MGAAPEWQANYVDLCDDRTLSFGAECVVCQARYVSATVPLSSGLPFDGAPDPDTARSINDQKLRVFTEFDQDYRSILLTCARCGTPSCPDCWDVDRQLCGACVADAGLMRAPPLGGPAQGPLAAGTLRRSQPGRYSEVGRPAWLKELLGNQSGDGGPGEAAQGSAPADSTADVRLFVDPAESTYPLVTPLPVQDAGIEPPPTDKLFASTEPAAAQPMESTGRLVTPEGQATSDISMCPRCGTPNYDFVTQCASCGLQLIQICPSCQRLNPADAKVCQVCATSLQRPMGWTSVSRTIEPVDPDVARPRISAGPAPAEPVLARPQVRQRASWSDELHDEAPVAVPPPPPRPERRPAEPRSVPPTPPRHERRSPAPLRQTRPPTYTAIAPEPAPMEFAPASFASPSRTPHPYDIPGVAELMPIIDDGRRQEQARQTQQMIGEVVALVERTLVVALLIGLFVVVGVATAAETSTATNQALLHALHFDVKAHVDQLLNSLHVLQSPR
jgi:ribosomal protein L37E